MRRTIRPLLVAVKHPFGLRGALVELLDEGLERELAVTAAGPLPEPFTEIIAADAEGHWRSADLWRNGVRIGRVIERRIETGTGEGASISLIASPPDAIEHAPAIYAAMMREAALGDGERTRCMAAQP